HFLKRVATSIVEVRDGRVVNYRGDYEAYLYSINQEIDAAESQQKGGQPSASGLTAKPARGKPSASGLAHKANKPPEHPDRPPHRNDRQQRKEIAVLEKTISRLEAQKKSVHDQLMTATDPAEALRLHHEFTTVSGELETAEQRWLQLQEK
ncbi:MAG TPA: ABC transporter ATP-binding protein, partial [Pirellulales bacterium]|nr:ABC transporter ATP-binding protein [Pirellulales bacterium]